MSKILILGGTRFLGRHFVDAALARGHDLTLFNRGKTDADAYPNIERIAGDRENAGDLHQLSTRAWDAVVDTSAYAANTARLSAEVLRGRVGIYAFISTISVYADSKVANFDESYPLAAMSEDDAAKVAKNADVVANLSYYGAQKVLCEREIERAFGDAALLVRAGLLIGPYDSTDRFTYWVRRVAEGGAVLVPDTPEQMWQLIDARDLAEWTLTMIERGQGGAYNVTGNPIRMDEILNTIRTINTSNAQFVPVSEQFLADENAANWEALPLWLPSSDPDIAGFWSCNVDKALGTGLTLRPISATIRDILAWDAGRGELRMGLKRDREAALLATYQSK